jgi:hypothetical protein
MDESEADSPWKPRRLDHAVLPVPTLEAARTRLTQLGFTVAPDAAHPFGTANCCVFLADGAYLEPLAVSERETCEREAIAGNVFVARDQAYRFRCGDNGFSALAFESFDAEADQLLFERKGISAGRMLRFSRMFRDNAGNAAEARFATAFAADLRAPDMFLLASQRLAMPDIGDAFLRRHENGVVGITNVIATESNPADFQYFLQDVINQRDQNAHSFGLGIAAANANICALTPDGFRMWLGASQGGAERGLRLRGIIFAVAEIGETRKFLESNGIAALSVGARLIVEPAIGQGAYFGFEESG